MLFCARFMDVSWTNLPKLRKSKPNRFAEMGAATTSFDAQDKTTRPTIDGFEAYKEPPTSK